MDTGPAQPRRHQRTRRRRTCNPTDHTALACEQRLERRGRQSTASGGGGRDHDWMPLLQWPAKRLSCSRLQTISISPAGLEASRTDNPLRHTTYSARALMRTGSPISSRNTSPPSTHVAAGGNSCGLPAEEGQHRAGKAQLTAIDSCDSCQFKPPMVNTTNWRSCSSSAGVISEVVTVVMRVFATQVRFCGSR